MKVNIEKVLNPIFCGNIFVNDSEKRCYILTSIVIGVLSGGFIHGVYFAAKKIMSCVRARTNKIAQTTLKQENPGGFRLLKGFTFKDRRDGYLTADSKPLGVASELDNAKAEMSSLTNYDKINPKLLQTLAGEYKIHLMPKVGASTQVIDRILEKIETDPKLKNCVSQYKVLPLDKNTGDYSTALDDLGGVMPRVVIYAESKKAAEYILQTMNALFKNDAKDFGSDITPRYNCKINSLIYYAQGSSHYKKKEPLANILFEADRVHFKEKTPGEYHLKPTSGSCCIL